MPALDFFPLPEPRPQQVEALAFVEKAFADGFNDVILELPTGGGKSAIGATLCRWLNGPTGDPLIHPGGYMLVVQKVLQDQIADDLERFSVGGFKAHLIKSALEYECPRFGKCGLAVKPCSFKRAGECPYKNAKEQFLASTLGVTNYAYYITDTAYVKSMMPRPIMILDEAHNLSKTLTGLVGIELSYAALEKRDPDLAEEMSCVALGIENFIQWVGNRYLPVCYERVQVLASMASDTDADDEDKREAYEARQEYERVNVAYQRVAENPEGWVYWHDVNERSDNLTLICKPIDVGPYFHDYFDRFPKRVFMSAYIGRKDVFCRDLGLDPSKVAHFKVNSDFDKERRPVHLLNAGSLSKKERETNLPKILRLAVKIATKHQERGIIHTHSYAFAEEVVQALQAAGLGDRITYPESTDLREAAIKKHADTPGSILISPSVYEGFDFKYDLCRWQIILKCPYGSLGDEVVKARMAKDRRWYQMETLKAFVQTCGRGMRAKDDSCTTYVLDSDITRLLGDTKGDLPKWFLEAIDDR